MTLQSWKEKIRKSFNNSLIIGLVVLVVVLVLIMVGVYYNGILQLKYSQAVYHNELRYRDSLSNKMEDLQANLVKTKDEYNREHTEKEVILSESKKFKDLDQRSRQMLDEFVDEFKTNQKNLGMAMRMQTQFSAEIKSYLEDSLKTTIIGEDTIIENIQHFSYTEPNGWFSWSGLVMREDSTGKPIIIGSPVIKEEFDVAIHRKRIPKRYFFDLFPPKITVAEVVSKNPYSTTTGMKTIYKSR